jgi:tRNA threonylcarbamoyladenosine biosynthesis protein TsaE
MYQEWLIDEQGWVSVVGAVLARVAAGEGRGAFLVLLSGDLGAGKTTFVQNVARALGVTQPVRSPTFPIEQRYSIDWNSFKTLVHMDAYRLEGIQELQKFRTLDEFSDPSKIFLIEWPEQIPGIEAYSHIKVSITESGIESRKVTLQSVSGTI